MLKVYEVAMQAPVGPLPFVDEIPHAGPVVVAARERAARQVEAQRVFELGEAEEADRRARAAAALPSAEQLRTMAEARALRFEFEGYTLWRVERDGVLPTEGGTEWVLTNPYGVDHCMRIRDLAGFERFLERVRNDEPIGLEPQADDDAPPRHWADEFATHDWCVPVEEAVAAIVSDSPHLVFGTQAADPGNWVDFRAAVRNLLGERLG